MKLLVADGSARRLRRTDRIRVFIVSDLAILREALCMLLASEEDIRVVGESVDGQEALNGVETLKPDIVLLDIQTPELDGCEVIVRLRAKSPGTKILILARALESSFVAGALRDGAKGCLMKTAKPRELVKAIRAVQDGEMWAERKALTECLEGLLQKVNDLSRPVSVAQEALTGREHEIVQWVSQGMTNKEVATRLSISEKTVKTHVSNIFRKLNISRRLELLLVDQREDLGLWGGAKYSGRPIAMNYRAG